MRLAVCWKVVDLRPDIDPLTGAVGATPLAPGVSAADRSALEWALRLAEAWGGDVVVVAAGSAADAEPLLREGVAAGGAVARRVALDPTLPSGVVAAALAVAAEDADVVVCGDASLDRGTGSVPGFMAAERGCAQALGLVTMEATPEWPGRVRGERRLDGGRREQIVIDAPGVLSVEAGPRLRRAALAAVRRAATAPIEVLPEPPAPQAPPTLRQRAPYRPRTRPAPGPDPGLSSRERILALTGALVERTPPARLVLDPVAAADRILAALTDT